MCFSGFPANIYLKCSKVMLLPPTYSLCAASALRVITTNREDTWTAESMLDISELFSAVALYAFQRLLVVYVDSLTPSSIFGEMNEKQSSNWKLQKSLQSVPWAGLHMGVEPKLGVFSPPNHPFVHRVFHYKPSILGYPYIWKHPHAKRGEKIGAKGPKSFKFLLDFKVHFRAKKIASQKMPTSLSW